MSDAWNDIQALKNRQSDIRARMRERRIQREGLAAELATATNSAPATVPAAALTDQSISNTLVKPIVAATTASPIKTAHRETVRVAADPEVEKKLLMVLCDISLDIPSDSKVITEHTSRLMEREVDFKLVEELLKKFAMQKLISIKFSEISSDLIVSSLDLSKLSDVTKGQAKKRRKDSDDDDEEELLPKQSKSVAPESGDIETLLSMQSTKEREEKKINEEIQELLVTQTAKEQYLVEKFKSRGGPQLQEFCQYGTREECQRTGPDGAVCKRLHFKKIINKHTDESLGDCSFLNTCFHMETCKETPALQNSLIGQTPQALAGQQNTNQDWLYNFGNNETILSYTDLKHNMIGDKFYPNMHNTDLSHEFMVPGQVSAHLPRPYSPVDAHHRVCPPCALSDGTHACHVGTPRYPPAAMPDAEAATDHLYPQPMAHSYQDLMQVLPSSSRTFSTMTLQDTAPVTSTEENCSTAYPYTSMLYSHNAPTPVLSVPSTKPGTDQPAWSSSDSSLPATVKPTTKQFKNTCTGTGVKKRIPQPEKWKKNLSKFKKIKGEEHLSRTGNIIPAKKVEVIDCSQCTFKCNDNFSLDLRQQLFDVFYSLGSNESQKQFVCQNVQEMLTKVKGDQQEKHENKRKVSRKYFLPDTDNTRQQVCSKFFCGTLAIGKTFISHALRHKQFGCYVGKEKRGKPHNKIPDSLLDPARLHIQSVLGAAASKGVKKNFRKKFIEQGLNITKMYDMYKSECISKSIAPVSLSMYRRVFHTEF